MADEASVFLPALFRMRNLAVLGLGGLLSFVFWNWFLLLAPLSLGVYGLAVFSSLNDATFRRRVAEKEQAALAALAPSKRPSMKVLEHFGGDRGPYGEAYKLACGQKDAIVKELEGGGTWARELLEEARPRLEGLMERLHDLTLRGAEIAKHLEANDAGRLRGEQAALRERGDAEGAAAKGNLLAQVEELASARERIEAQILRVSDGLAEMRGNVLALAGAEANALEAGEAQIDRQVEDLGSEVRLLKESLDEVYH